MSRACRSTGPAIRVQNRKSRAARAWDRRFWTRFRGWADWGVRVFPAQELAWIRCSSRTAYLVRGVHGIGGSGRVFGDGAFPLAWDFRLWARFAVELLGLCLGLPLVDAFPGSAGRSLISFDERVCWNYLNRRASCRQHRAKDDVLRRLGRHIRSRGGRFWRSSWHASSWGLASLFFTRG